MSLLGYVNDIPFDVFMNICKAGLDKVAPLKQKYVRSNHNPFLNKESLKAIVNRRNFCHSLVRKAKKCY